MKSIMKPLLAGILLAVAGSSMAVQKDITVTANVDSALDMTMADNTSLPKAVEMQYNPSGLVTYSVGMTKIWSNAVDADAGDIHMSLVTPAELVNTVGTTATTVPLTVKWGSDVVSAESSQVLNLKTSEIFPNGDAAISTGSVAKELTIAQTTRGPLGTGTYQGVVSLYLFQDAATAP